MVSERMLPVRSYLRDKPGGERVLRGDRQEPCEEVPAHGGKPDVTGRRGSQGRRYEPCRTTRNGRGGRHEEKRK